jgi:hypothetical protein
MHTNLISFALQYRIYIYIVPDKLQLTLTEGKVDKIAQQKSIR